MLLYYNRFPLGSIIQLYGNWCNSVNHEIAIYIYIYMLYHVQSSRFMVVNHRNELPWYHERNRDGIR